MTNEINTVKLMSDVSKASPKAPHKWKAADIRTPEIIIDLTYWGGVPPKGIKGDIIKVEIQSKSTNQYGTAWKIAQGPKGPKMWLSASKARSEPLVTETQLDVDENRPTSVWARAELEKASRNLPAARAAKKCEGMDWMFDGHARVAKPIMKFSTLYECDSCDLKTIEIRMPGSDVAEIINCNDAVSGIDNLENYMMVAESMLEEGQEKHEINPPSRKVMQAMRIKSTTTGFVTKSHQQLKAEMKKQVDELPHVDKTNKENIPGYEYQTKNVPAPKAKDPTEVMITKGKKLDPEFQETLDHLDSVTETVRQHETQMGFDLEEPAISFEYAEKMWADYQDGNLELSELDKAEIKKVLESRIPISEVKGTELKLKSAEKGTFSDPPEVFDHIPELTDEDRAQIMEELEKTPSSGMVVQTLGAGFKIVPSDDEVFSDPFEYKSKPGFDNTNLKKADKIAEVFIDLLENQEGGYVPGYLTYRCSSATSCPRSVLFNKWEGDLSLKDQLSVTKNKNAFNHARRRIGPAEVGTAIHERIQKVLRVIGQYDGIDAKFLGHEGEVSQTFYRDKSDEPANSFMLGPTTIKLVGHYDMLMELGYGDHAETFVIDIKTIKPKWINTQYEFAKLEDWSRQLILYQHLLGGIPGIILTADRDNGELHAFVQEYDADKFNEVLTNFFRISQKERQHLIPKLNYNKDEWPCNKGEWVCPYWDVCHG